MGLLLEHMTASWLPSVPPHFPMLTLAVRLGTGMSVLGIATASFGLLGLYRFTALLIIFTMGWSRRAHRPVFLCISNY